MILRTIASKIQDAVTKFPAVTITGPRQSGKSTLVKYLFPNYGYVTLEDEDLRTLAAQDTRAFLRMHPAPCIIDEAQRAPTLFSYLQGVLDEANTPGQYIITGSQNFLLSQHVSQSLAGRVAVLNLLPLSFCELAATGIAPTHAENWLYSGGYPRIYNQHIDPPDFFNSYIQTYIERDIRKIENITKLADFERFLPLCAARSSQLLNKSELARDCQINQRTVTEWLSILNASFLITLIQPYYKNYGKRLIKTPKLYFLDTGLAANLVGIEEEADIAMSAFKGALFESAVASEIYKHYLARGRRPKLYYWRDSDGVEVDFLIEKGLEPHVLIEVKASETYSPAFFKNLDIVGGLLGVPTDRRFVIYAGAEKFETSRGTVLPFSQMNSITL